MFFIFRELKKTSVQELLTSINSSLRVIEKNIKVEAGGIK